MRIWHAIFLHRFCHFWCVIKLCRNKTNLWLSETENRNEKALVEKYLLMMQKYSQKYCNFSKFGQKSADMSKMAALFNLFFYISNVNMLNYIRAKFHVNSMCFADFKVGEVVIFTLCLNIHEKACVE